MLTKELQILSICLTELPSWELALAALSIMLLVEAGPRTKLTARLKFDIQLAPLNV